MRHEPRSYPVVGQARQAWSMMMVLYTDLGTLGSGKSPESPVIRASYGADLDLLDNKKDAKPILKLDTNTYNQLSFW